MSLLSDSTIYPHFRLSAETYPLTSFIYVREAKGCHWSLCLLHSCPCSIRASSFLNFVKDWSIDVFVLSVLSQTPNLFKPFFTCSLPFDPTAPRFRCNAIGRMKIVKFRKTLLHVLSYVNKLSDCFVFPGSGIVWPVSIFNW